MSKQDYTKFSKPEKTMTVAENEAVVEVEEVVEPEKKTIIGIVDNCVKLNVRKEPTTHSEVLCIVDRKAEVVIDMDESTEDFYKICTAAGIEGFCVKYFVTIES